MSSKRRERSHGSDGSPTVPPSTSDVSDNRPSQAGSTSSLLLSPPAGIGDDIDSKALQRLPSQQCKTGGQALVVQHLIDTYFARIYTISWHGFIHQSSFRRSVTEGRASTPLVHSIYAAASVIACPKEPGVGTWTESVRQALPQAIMHPTVELLAAILNLIFFENAHTGSVTAVWNLTGLAIRMAYALRLNIESSDARFTVAQQEMRRRLMWACYCWDTIVSSGIKELSIVPLESLHIGLPCNERNYLYSMQGPTRMLRLPLEQSVATGTLHEGLLANTITVMAIRSKISKYVCNLTRDSVPPWQVNSTFASCVSDLQQWEKNLGPQYQFDEVNMAARHVSHQLNQLVGLHVLCHQCMCDLNRIAIYGFAESADPKILEQAPFGWLRSAQEDCFDAAVKVTETVFTLTQAFPDASLDDSAVLVCLYESIRVQIWGFTNLLHGEDSRNAQFAAIPRIHAAISQLMKAQATLKGAIRLVDMVRRVLHRTQFQILLGEHFALSGSGTLTPAEDTAKYPTLSAQGRHNWISRVHQELSQVASPARRMESRPPRELVPTVPATGAGEAVTRSSGPVAQSPLQWSDILSDLPASQMYGNVGIPHEFGSQDNTPGLASLYTGIQPSFSNEMLSTNLSMDYLLNWGLGETAVAGTSLFQHLEDELHLPLVPAQWSGNY